jgi:hypothetical protein
MNNNLLSAEQKLKIEENKRKALEKRLHSQDVQTKIEENKRRALEKLKNHSPKGDGKLAAAPVPQSSGYGRGKPGGTSQNAHSVPCGSKSAVPKKASFVPGHGRGKGKGSGPLAGIGNKEFYGINSKPLRGQCVLISKDRFEVKMPFSQPVVEVFKTIPTRMYGKCVCACTSEHLCKKNIHVL